MLSRATRAGRARPRGAAGGACFRITEGAVPLRSVAGPEPDTWQVCSAGDGRAHAAAERLGSHWPTLQERRSVPYAFILEIIPGFRR